MLDFFKKIFERNVEESITQEELFPEEKAPLDECANCELKELCIQKRLCNPTEDGLPQLKNFDEGKETLLIIDDNEGVISFLKDDIENFYEKGILKEDEINLLLLTTSNAGFALQKLYNKDINLNIKWAIIDITLGGSKMTTEGNIKLTGVDVFEMIYNNSKDFKFLFYTGNNLNPYIKSNEKLIQQFKNITNDDIKKYVLFKTSMDIEKRRQYIMEKLFKEK